MTPVRIGPYLLDPLSHVLRGEGDEVQLSPLGSRLLQALAAEPGAVVERTALIREFWRDDFLTGDRALNRVISEIRRAVGDDPRNPALIQTVHRRGYRLAVSAAPDLQAQAAAGSAGAPRMGPLTRVWLMAMATFALVAGGLACVLAFSTLARLFR